MVAAMTGLPRYGRPRNLSQWIYLPARGVKVILAALVGVSVSKDVWCLKPVFEHQSRVRKHIDHPAIGGPAKAGIQA